MIAALVAALRPGPRAIVQAHELIRRRHARASCGLGVDPACAGRDLGCAGRDLGTCCDDCPDAVPASRGRA